MKPKTVHRYNVDWPASLDPVRIEMQCIQNGGQWRARDGRICGVGELTHFRNLDRLLWPTDYNDKWSALILKEFVKGGVVGIAGPSSSGKTHYMAKCGLMLYWCWPQDTTVLCTTTTRELLEMRIWGEIKKLFKAARKRVPWLSGHLTDSAQSIMTDGKGDEEGRDFRNGLKGLACKRGDRWVGLGDFVGIKNNILLVLSDEAPLMQAGFYESMGNLRSNSAKRPFTMLASGNPKDPIDSFGSLCQPRLGWDTLEQGDRTQVWETREAGGRCIRLVGTDSPNLDFPEGAEPFRKLIGRQYISEIEQSYGKDSWQYDAWVLARFPTQVLARRLFTRAFCEKFRAFEEPQWDEQPIVKLFALDAAYRGVGGDRCVGGEFWLGHERSMPRATPDGFVLDGVVTQVLALVGKPILVPIKSGGELPEDQVADFVRVYCERASIPASHVFYDGTGRSTLTAAFSRLWSTQVNAIEFGGAASDRPDPQDPEHKTCDESYANFASELNWSLRAAIEARQFRGMTLDIVEEAEQRGWEVVAGSRSKTKIEPKDETKERLKRSPDLLDMAICGVEGARRLGFAIKRLASQRAARVGGDGERHALRAWRDRWQQIQRAHELTNT